MSASGRDRNVGESKGGKERVREARRGGIRGKPYARISESHPQDCQRTEKVLGLAKATKREMEGRIK